MLGYGYSKNVSFFVLSGGEGADSPLSNFMPFGHSFSWPVSSLVNASYTVMKGTWLAMPAKFLVLRNNAND